VDSAFSIKRAELDSPPFGPQLCNPAGLAGFFWLGPKIDARPPRSKSLIACWQPAARIGSLDVKKILQPRNEILQSIWVEIKRKQN
jgi:hypothetical protein